MNIGIDIDKTLTKYPEFFIWLSRKILEDKGKVYLITGLGHNSAIKKLEPYPKDFYTELIDTSLYNSEERNLIGKELNNEKIVGRFKQRMCKELNVDIMFDDNASIHREYGNIPIFEVK